MSFCCIVYPSVLITYLGQAAFLMRNPESVPNTFYDSIPDPVYWPMFVISILAAIVASQVRAFTTIHAVVLPQAEMVCQDAMISIKDLGVQSVTFCTRSKCHTHLHAGTDIYGVAQAIISGTFSIIRQSLMLGCFPRVKIVHTSGIVEGQIYIPEANWTLMVLTIIVVAGFRDSLAISNAYGRSLRLDLPNFELSLGAKDHETVTFIRGVLYMTNRVHHSFSFTCCRECIHLHKLLSTALCFCLVKPLAQSVQCWCCRGGSDICNVDNHYTDDYWHPGNLEAQHLHSPDLLYHLWTHRCVLPVGHPEQVLAWRLVPHCPVR